MVFYQNVILLLTLKKYPVRIAIWKLFAVVSVWLPLNNPNPGTFEMKAIRLNRGYLAFVDDEDYEYLNQSNWTVATRKGVNYAQSARKINGKWQPVLMHRIIMQPAKGVRIDHKDGNGHNNQRKNLRLCNASQNEANGNSRGGKSIYKGIRVRRYKRKTPPTTVVMYDARITFQYKQRHLGAYNNEKDAAKAYNKAAIKYFGEFAKLNKI